MAAVDTAKLLASLTLKDGFTGPLKAASKALDGFDSKLTKSQSRAFKAGEQIGNGIKNSAKLIASAGLIAGVAVGGLFAKSISAASDLNETLSKAQVVFGKASAAVFELGKTSATALGLSQNAAVGAAATYGNLFVSMGLAQEKSADMSIALVKLAADLASFNNIDPGEALEKLRAGITGESEPLKTLGININETIIKQRALELGLVTLAKGQKKYTDVLPAAARAQAAYSLILQQSKTAQGDVARTSDGLANQTRFLAAQWEDLKATLAGPALPQLAKILKSVNRIVQDNIPLIGKLGDNIAGLFSDENIAKGADILTHVFDTAVAAAPILQKTAEATLGIINTAVGVFKSLPPELQALAVTGLAVNKLTGGLVTNIAGGLISAVISSFKGLMNVNAAVVNVNGPVGGVGGAAAAGGGLLSTAASLAVPVTILAIGAEAAKDLANADIAGKGFTGKFETPGSGILPFGIDASLHNIAQALDLFNQNEKRKTGPAASELTADRHIADLVQGVDNTAAELRTADRHLGGVEAALDPNTSAILANTRAAKELTSAQIKSVIASDRDARGIKNGKISTSIDPRLRFLAQNQAGSKDVAVSHALALGFERAVTPLFRKTDQIPRAIRALQKDQHQLLVHGDTKSARLIGGDIDRLKAELTRRQDRTTRAIQRQKQTKLTAQTIVKTITQINGRLLSADTNRFTSQFTSHAVSNFD